MKRRRSKTKTRTVDPLNLHVAGNDHLTPATVRKRGGPKTAKGREVAKMNATKDGLRSVSPVVEALGETEEGWQEHLAEVMATIKPGNIIRRQIAEAIAKDLWQLQRVDGYRQATVAQAAASAEARAHEAAWGDHGTIIHPDDIRARSGLAEPRAFEKANRAQVAAQRSLERNYRLLKADMEREKSAQSETVLLLAAINVFLTNEPASEQPRRSVRSNIRRRRIEKQVKKD